MPAYFGNRTDPILETAGGSVQPHGGDVYEREIRMDFSVSINPYAEEKERLYQAGVSGLQMAGLYPDPYCRKLVRAISRLEGVPEANILCGNGASELFMALVHALRPEKVLLAVPCYAGYETVLAAMPDCRILLHKMTAENGFVPDESLLEAVTEEMDLVFLADPNNPTGRLIKEELLKALIEKCGRTGTILVIDACFYPLTGCGAEGGAAVERIRHGYDKRHVIVVKAFTKAVAIPGLRLGYLLAADPLLLSEIRKHLPEWNVSTVAQEVGTEAAALFYETDFLKKSADFIEKERNWLSGQLKDLGLKVFASDANYLLAESGVPLYRRLLEQKILTRNCASFSGLDDSFLRLAVRTHEENSRLVDAIKTIMKS